MQQEYSNAGNAALDISKIINNGFRCIKRYWFQLILLGVIVVLATICYSNYKYDPIYTSSVTYAVNKTDYTTVDSDIAKRLSNSLQQLNTLSEFKNELLKNVKAETRNTDFSISSQFTEDITLFTVNITAKRYENANIILDNFMEIYPRWASKSTGAVELQIVGTTYSSSSSVSPYALSSIILRGIMLALVLCGGIIYLYTRLVKTVVKESDMRKIGVRNCITVVPEVKIKKRKLATRNNLLITNQRVDWGFEQSILAAQSRIENQLEAENRKVIVVTSTMPQEGKSSVTTNLAIAFAQKGLKVLLIDGDFRKPSVAKVLGEEEKKGLTDCFIDLVHPSKLTQKIGELDYISAGSYEGAVSGILDHKIMKVLMKRWRAYYDYILIDTAPSLYTDASLFAQYADAVIYVVRYDTCDVKEIKEYITKYVVSGKLIGYVLNRNPGGFSTYGRYGRYGRYGKYGKYGKYKRYIEHEQDDTVEMTAADITEVRSREETKEVAIKEKHSISSMNTEDTL